MEGDIAFVVVRENKNHMQSQDALRTADCLQECLPSWDCTTNRDQYQEGDTRSRGKRTPQWAIYQSINVGKENYTLIAGKKQKYECCPQKTHFGPEGPVFAWATWGTNMCHMCP